MLTFLRRFHVPQTGGCSSGGDMFISKRRFGVAMIVVGVLFLLPRLIGGDEYGVSPMIGIMFCVFGAARFRSGRQLPEGK